MNLNAKQKKKKLILNQAIVSKLSLKKLLIVNFQKMIKKNLYIVVMKKLRMKFLDVVLILKKVMKMN